jgi:hypothetical protein
MLISGFILGRNMKTCTFDECISINHFTGPAASIYGNEKQINLDICQHCFNELLGYGDKLLKHNVGKNII